jgi:uncharacterized membrane protein
MTTIESRSDRFARELAALKVSDPAKGRPRMWQNVGAGLMVLGVALAVIAYFVSQRTGDLLDADTAINIALLGITLAVVGSAVFLRYSLTGFLRFWLARQSYELSMLAERGFAAPGAGIARDAFGHAVNGIPAEK